MISVLDYLLHGSILWLGGSIGMRIRIVFGLIHLHHISHASTFILADGSNSLACMFVLST